MFRETRHQLLIIKTLTTAKDTVLTSLTRDQGSGSGHWDYSLKSASQRLYAKALDSKVHFLTAGRVLSAPTSNAQRSISSYPRRGFDRSPNLWGK